LRGFRARLDRFADEIEAMAPEVVVAVSARQTA
jgi:hypothetical protein